ncbi:citrate synthase, mitochondrial-like, partial [Prorops nasuta]|uniref:citrate synthase, mitochondrial-like n=1 Tax=Prorops nasuta TaxID=863751 RepID=UPI0034CD9248
RNEKVNGAKRRGTPSSSNDLKEALSEKIPLHHDLIRNFRRLQGSTIISNITVDSIYQGLQNISAIVRDTSEVDAKAGIRFRGFSIPEILNVLPRRGISPRPEAMFWLLLTGDVPTEEQTTSLMADWTSRRQRRIELWSKDDRANIINSILQAVPNTFAPLQKFSIILTALASGAINNRQAFSNDISSSYTNWENTFEDSMELLAILPEIVGLIVQKSHNGRFVMDDNGEWIHPLLKHLDNTIIDLESKKLHLEDFLRLYITLNADEDGGNPTTHVAHILSALNLDVNLILAAKSLAYTNEPQTGTMRQYMVLQHRIQMRLGTGHEDDILREYAAAIISRNETLIGFRKSDIPDARYVALLNYAREYLPQSIDVKLSQNIARIFIMVMRNRQRNIVPEQSAIAAPIFQYYGMTDMDFNQVLLYMSRTLGVIASMIWSKAMSVPAEHPISKSTRSYVNLIEEIYKNKPLSRL